MSNLDVPKMMETTSETGMMFRNYFHFRIPNPDFRIPGHFLRAVVRPRLSMECIFHLNRYLRELLSWQTEDRSPGKKYVYLRLSTGGPRYMRSFYMRICVYAIEKCSTKFVICDFFLYLPRISAIFIEKNLNFNQNQ